MNIGIDIDGCLTDIEEFQKIKGKEVLKKDIINPKAYALKDIFDLTDEEDTEFWNNNFEDYIKNYPARNNASEITNRLHEDGNKIYIITARHYEEGFKFMKPDEMPKIVQAWLDKMGIYYDEIILTKKTKIHACREKHIDYMVEDWTKNIIELSNICKVIIFDTSSNKDLNIKNTFHASSWNEIYSIIRQK